MNIHFSFSVLIGLTAVSFLNSESINDGQHYQQRNADKNQNIFVGVKLTRGSIADQQRRIEYDGRRQQENLYQISQHDDISPQAAQQVSFGTYGLIEESISPNYFKGFTPSKSFIPKEYTQQQSQEHIAKDHRSNSYFTPQVQIIPENELLKILEKELSQKTIQGNEARHKGSEKRFEHTQVEYRPQSFNEHYEAHNYVSKEEPKPYIVRPQYRYQKAVLNHPLAQSSLEKELEKLIASNKPERVIFSAPSSINFQKAHTSNMAQQNKYTLFPDMNKQQKSKTSQTSNREQYTQINPQFEQSERIQYQPLVQLVRPQFFTEDTTTRQIPRANIALAQSKPQIFLQPQRQSYYQPHLGNSKESTIKIVDPPKFHQNNQYSAQTAQLDSQKVVYEQPFDSTIYAAQNTGQVISKNTNGRKQILPPQHGKPISQEEFQALLDAGYPVTAIPVPVPYEKYINEQTVNQQTQQPLRVQKGQPNLSETRPGVTFLRPINSSPYQEEHRKVTSQN